ncbi:hypothetical protein RAN89_13740 [Rhodoferax mekongensis]|uniref:Uncharacterized protein n=1 Tax=Rhodoferax mekongensis TaxID=3068341 RepID=A0ABZ0B4C3_9BURK|nr:hypothetical protein [Rhodoferax sp. TBRC 17307]WNO06771.1 hypothetical protein RAN89_13740 [Rhodoferax sp. TBRC 17307]
MLLRADSFFMAGGPPSKYLRTVLTAIPVCADISRKLSLCFLKTLSSMYSSFVIIASPIHGSDGLAR